MEENKAEKGGLVLPNSSEKYASSFMDPSEKRLMELGYKQELRRELNLVEIISMSVSVMNPIITVVPFYAIALSYGGPLAVMWPWWPVVAFVICVGLCLAEISSSFPTTGALYFWAASMSSPQWAPLVAWTTAWLQLVAVTVGNASVAYPAAQIIQQIILLISGGANGGGYWASKGVFFAIYCAIVLSWACINSLNIRWTSIFLNFYAYFIPLYVIALCIVLPAIAQTHQKASYVYKHWETSSTITGVHGTGFNWMFASLLPHFCFFGFDAAAYITEETKNADRSAPKAIMISIFVEIVLGYSLLNALTFSIQGYWGDLFSPENATGGRYPVAQIIYDAFHKRYGNGTGAYILLILMVIPFFASGQSGALGAARHVYAQARDKAMPFPSIFSYVSTKAKVPVCASWFVAIAEIFIVLHNFGSMVAFNAIASVAAVGYLGTYLMPILARLLMDDAKFKRGPFHLGGFTKPLCVVSIVYVVYTMIIFMVPTMYPVNIDNFNYGSIAFTTVMTLALLWWAVDARRWFKGPVRTSDVSSSDNEMKEEATKIKVLVSG